MELPDRSILSADFHPREPCSAAYEVVRGALRADAPTFVLFNTPPRRDLPDDLTTLLDLGLVPAARVFISFAGGALATEALAPETLALLDQDVGDEAVPESRPVVPGGAPATAPAPVPKKAGGKPSWLKL